MSVKDIIDSLGIQPPAGMSMPNMPVLGMPISPMLNQYQPFPNNQTLFNVIILCYKSEKSVDMIYQSQNPFTDEQSAIHYMKYMALYKAIEFARNDDVKVSSIEDKSENDKYNYRYSKIHLNGDIFVEGFVYNVFVIDLYNVRYRGHFISRDTNSDHISVINEANPYTSNIPDFKIEADQPVWYKKAMQYIDKSIEDDRINSTSEIQKRKAYLRRRQAEGIEAAKKRGVYKGRKYMELPELNSVAKQYRNKEITLADATRNLGISKTTFYRRMKEAGL